MQEIKPLNEYSGKKKKIFLAGGISNCKDWQCELKDYLKDEDVVLFNPRRDNFTLNKKNSMKQIEWEFNSFKKSNAVSFWFTHETLCPITLFELGKESELSIPVFVGIDPKYVRRLDLEIQLKLLRPEIKIVYSIKDLAKQLKNWIRTN